MVFLLLGFTFIGSSLFYEKAKNTFRNKWVGALLIYVSFLFIWKYMFPIVFNRAEGIFFINFWTVRQFINAILGIFMLITIVENVNYKTFINISKFLCWMGFLFAVYGILQYLKLDPFFLNNSQWRFPSHVEDPKIFMVTFMNNKFLSSHYVALLAPLCLMFKDLRYKIMFLTMGVMVVLTTTLTSITAYFCSLLLYLFFTGKKKMFFGLLAVCISVTVWIFLNKPSLFSFSGRMEIWSIVLKDIYEKKNILFGDGLGSFSNTKYMLKNLHAIHAHNEYIQFLKEGGLVLVVIVFGYLITLFRRLIPFLYNNINSMIICYILGLLSYLIISIGGFPLRIAPLALILIIYLAGIEYQLNQRRI